MKKYGVEVMEYAQFSRLVKVEADSRGGAFDAAIEAVLNESEEGESVENSFEVWACYEEKE